MALPKKKISRTRRGNRRSHWKFKSPTLVLCSHCNSAKLPHKVCPECGYYNDKQVIEVKE